MVAGLTPQRQQSENDCGAAALSIMLGRWGIAAHPADILSALPGNPGEGIPAGDLRDFARARGLGAFVIRGEVRDLENELALQHPVLVGLILRQGDRGLPHYEVVAGINPGARRLFMLDPARGPREDGYDGFLAEWEQSGRVTLVVTGPNPTPTSGKSESWRPDVERTARRQPLTSQRSVGGRAN